MIKESILNDLAKDIQKRSILLKKQTAPLKMGTIKYGDDIAIGLVGMLARKHT